MYLFVSTRTTMELNEAELVALVQSMDWIRIGEEVKIVRIDDTIASIQDCTCVEFCSEDPRTACSLSGIPHVHPDDGSKTFGPCPIHPDRPGDH